jgi:hypothetical protein
MNDATPKRFARAYIHNYIPAALILSLICACGKPAETAPQPLTPVKVEQGEAPAAELLKKEDSEKIKVKRDKDGSYSWEISGKEVKGIVEADRALKRRLVQEDEKEK